MAVKSIQYDRYTFDISYEIINPDAKADVIVLHGWGSNKNIMKQAFSPYLKGFRHIYIDLPGFGNSTCNTALKTSDYARIVELLMVHINASKDIIVGHSFGGKVAVLLEPDVLVLLSSAGIYTKKSLKVRTKIALFKMLKVFGFSKIRKYFVAEDAKSLSSHMYETFKNVVNEDFSVQFRESKSKALLCWGENDTATPLSSGQKIDALMKDSKLVVYPGDHYFFTQNAKSISALIEDTFIKRLER
ncbi:alpha/beta hydrolase [Sulfurimonas sp. HSL-1716]|uniref:alpha/beta fold hydrolase n=1 Tax=Hydrocurvibacter sulfurireducens TaxID=3131937 RepID=UPI0031F85E8D